jgi:hypothetical protein
MTYRDLTADEVAALQAFAARYGRFWKSKLTDVYWYNARLFRDASGDETHGYALHRLRNELGPRWLASYKLPKGN